MSTSRRNALLTLAALPLASTGAEKSEREKEDAKPFLGSWFGGVATTSLILSIEPHGEVLFVFLENGAFSIMRTTWKLLSGGMLIDGFPRFRLWEGVDPENIRAEMEPLPEDLEVSDGFRRFPRKIFLRRAATGRVTRDLQKRPLPSGWENPAVEKKWDEEAGKRR